MIWISPLAPLEKLRAPPTAIGPQHLEEKRACFLRRSFLFTKGQRQMKSEAPRN